MQKIQRILVLKAAIWEACKETASVLAGTVLVLAFSALGLHLASPATSSYLMAGMGIILFVSLLFSLGRLMRQQTQVVRPVVANCISVYVVSTVLFLAVPVTIERSISMFLLQVMAAEAAKGHDATELESALVSGYLCNHAAITKRMEEERQLGTVELLPQGAYALTARGRALASWLRPIGKAFAVPPRVMLGQCTSLPVKAF